MPVNIKEYHLGVGTRYALYKSMDKLKAFDELVKTDDVKERIDRFLEGLTDD
jgi:hypothetical protein